MNPTPKVLNIGFAGPAGAGKSTCAARLVQELCARRTASAQFSFAESLKETARESFGWDGVKDERGRRLLQVLGAEAGRGYDPDLWVRMRDRKVQTFAKHISMPGDLRPSILVAVADDVRFQNEVDSLDMVFLIRRLGHEGSVNRDPQAHESERWWMLRKVNTVIFPGDDWGPSDRDAFEHGVMEPVRAAIEERLLG